MGPRLTLGVMCVLLAFGAGAAAQEANARAQAIYDHALELEARGNHSAALLLLWEAAGLAPHDPDIQNRLGEALERIGALDAAVDAYRVALSDRPSFQKASNNLILALVKAGKAPEAIARARALVTEAPADPERWFTLGLAQSDADVNEAIKSFRRVLDLAPRHTLARYNLALVLQHADRFPEAIAELERALTIEPRAESYYSLGVIYWHQGDLERAVTALRAAIARQPDGADAHAALGAALKARRDWPGAAAALRRAIALDPDRPASHYTLAQVLQSRGDEEGARREFAEADRLRRRGEQSQEAGVWTTVGTQKLGSGEFTGAVDCFRHAIAVYPEYAPAHYQLGRALQKLGQRDAARAAFARAHELNPSLVAPPDAR